MFSTKFVTKIVFLGIENIFVPYLFSADDLYTFCIRCKTFFLLLLLDIIKLTPIIICYFRIEAMHKTVGPSV